MSSSMLAESIDNTKSDNSVIIFVNPDGTLTVDQVTLQTLLSNQNNVPLNVVKVSEKNSSDNVGDNNATPQINLHVEGFYSDTTQPATSAPVPSTTSLANTVANTVVASTTSTVVTTSTTSTTNAVTPVDGEIDPFLEMDPEQLERLETALQSEQAKQILGENVAAMLDMLNVEDDNTQMAKPSPTTPTITTTSLREAIRLDHCYTTLIPAITSSEPSDSSVTSPVISNTNTTRLRGRGRGFRGASRTQGRGRSFESVRGPLIDAPVELPNVQETPISPLRQSSSPLVLDDNNTNNPSHHGLLFPRDQIYICTQQENSIVGSPYCISSEAPIFCGPDNPDSLNTVNQSSSAKVVVTKLPDIIDGTSAGLTLTEAMLDAKLQETQTEFSAYPPADEDSTEELTQTQDDEEEEEEQDDSSSDQDFVLSPQKRSQFSMRGRKRREHPRGSLRKRGRGRGRGGGGGPPTTNLINENIDRSPSKKSEECTSPIQPTRRISAEKKIKVKIPKEQTSVKEPIVTPTTPTTPTTLGIPITISRTIEITKESQQKKNYPKRENRKPPAHLVDSFGPALFSTPDIIRRVSTGEKDSPEKKPTKDEEQTDSTLEMINTNITSQDTSIAETNPSNVSTDILPRGGSVEITQDSSGPFEMNSTILSLTSEDPETSATPIRQSKRQSVKSRRQSEEKPTTPVKTKRASIDSSEQLSTNSTVGQVENEDEASSADESWNSEDDPNRLWCICKKPHNNRFMICCDQCEDWFHGKCVGVTKALGKQMEAKGIEWSCPKCLENKDGTQTTLTNNKPKSGPMNLQNVGDKTPGTKKLVQQRLNVIKLKVPTSNTIPPKTIVTTAAVASVATTSSGNPGHSQLQINPKSESGKASCIVCKKEPRENSIYCSDGCILKHAQDSQPSKPSSGPSPKLVVATTHPPGAKAAALNIKKTAIEVKPSKTLLQKSSQSIRPTSNLSKETHSSSPSQSTQSPSQTSNPPVKKGRSAAKASYQAEVALKQKTLMVQQGGKVVISEVSPSCNNQNAPISKVPATSTVKEYKHQKKIDNSKRVSSDKDKERDKDKEKEKEKDREEHKVSGTESIRDNVRKTLQMTLSARVKEANDLDISEEKIKKIAFNVEEELYNFFGDIGMKYKSRYRSLVFNIRDAKNLTLFKKIVEKLVTPHQLVRLSPEQLASQELAEWRERETKHQLEIIQKNELDLLSLGKTYVMKTHKGEQFIESEEGLKTESALDLKNEDLVNVLNNSVSSTVEEQGLENIEEKKDDELKKERHEEKKKEKERKDKKDRKESRDYKKDKERDRRREKDRKRKRNSDKKHDDKKRDRRDKSRERDRDKERSKEKEREKEKDRDRDKDKDKDKDKERDKEKEKEKHLKSEKVMSTPTNTNEKVIKDDSDQSDREPSSTVNIKTPDINGEEPQTSTTPTGPPPGPPLIDSPIQTTQASVETPSFWKGYISMPDVSKFYTSIHVAYGNSENLSKDMPEAADIVGRISPETVWEYMAKMKRSATKEIVVVYMNPMTEEDKSHYFTLYNYLNSRGRLGVVGNLSKMIKDFYLMPLPANEPIPKVLLPIEGPGFGDSDRNLLIGIMVRARRKRILTSDSTYMARNKRTITEAPPNDNGGYTPPQSPRIFKKKENELTSIQPPPPPLGNEDEPYSPGEADAAETNEIKIQANSPPTVNPAEDILTAPKALPTDLQRKMEEINRQIAESKRQIQTMSSSLTNEVKPTSSNSPLLTKTLPTLLDSNFVPAEIGLATTAVSPFSATNSKKIVEDDDNEAYSPSRSFTPPTTNDTIPFLGSSSGNSTSVLAQLPSNISLPSNLSEILASIKKRECETTKIDLKSDPIVQSYKEGTSPIEDEEDFEPKIKKTKDTIEDKKSLSSSETSSPLDTTPEPRDPRQRAAAARGPQEVNESESSTSGSKLSKLTDDELIRKAMEMEAIEAHSTLVHAAPIPLKDKSMIIPPSIHKIINDSKSQAPSPQPKPPGLEDEPQPEFTGYPPPSLAFTNKPPPPGAPIQFPSNIGPRHPRFFPPPPPPHHTGPPHSHPGMFRPNFRPPPPPGHPAHIRPPPGHPPGHSGHSGPPRFQGHLRPPPLWDSNIPRPPPPHIMNFRKHDTDKSSHSNQGSGSWSRNARWENKSENKDSGKVSSVKRKSTGDIVDST